MTARINAQVKSATDSVSTSGVFVTMTPRDARGGHVEVVVAHRDVRDDLQIGAGVEHLPFDLLREHCHQRVFAGDPGAKLLGGDRLSPE